jgi:mRNA-degrading endonuclease RelE of RelBE toxin-antitoxin system
MAKPRPYRVELSRTAARELRRLQSAERERVKDALRREAARVADSAPGRGGKSVKAIRGHHDEFQRLRVGAWRVMFDLDREARALRVLGIVARRDLDRWLRRR